MLDGLAFLPTEHVEEGVDFRRDNTPDGLEELVDYFNATYVSGCLRRRRRVPPLYDPEKWNVYQMTLDSQPRTNNLCDSWNRSFQQLVGFSHPTVWQAIEGLRKDAILVRINTPHEWRTRGQHLKKRVAKETIDMQKRLLGIIMWRLQRRTAKTWRRHCVVLVTTSGCTGECWTHASSCSVTHEGRTWKSKWTFDCWVCVKTWRLFQLCSSCLTSIRPRCDSNDGNATLFELLKGAVRTGLISIRLFFGGGREYLF